MFKSLSVKKLLQLSLSLETLIIFCVMSIALIRKERPSIYFDEGSLITYLSGFQLLIIAFFAHQIEQIKKRKNSHEKVLWKIIKIGFIALSFDEILMIHERLDYLIQSVFRLPETFLTKRIDDFIVFMYLVLSFLCFTIIEKNSKNIEMLFLYFSSVLFFL